VKTRGLKETTRRYIRQRDNYTCWRCGDIQVVQSPYACDVRSPSPGLPDYLFVFQVDHLLPRKYGGTDALWNLALACQPCNEGRQAALEPEAISLAHLQWLAYALVDNHQ
jgi:5-methylcytosine-specific restriction endonuclease McrA